MPANAIPPLMPRAPYLGWCIAHAASFGGNPTGVGLTAARVTAYEALIKAAQSAIDTMDQKKSEYHNSVQDVETAMRNLAKGTNGTAELVATVRAFADSSANPAAVLSLAQLDPIAPPGPAVAPNAPTSVTVGIEPTTGAIVLRWKASQPGPGVVYIVKRRLSSEGAWQYVGSAGSDKTFTDNTFAPGPDSVQYSIQAQRSNLFSTPTAVVVNFGAGGGGGEVSVAAVKLAA